MRPSYTSTAPTIGFGETKPAPRRARSRHRRIQRSSSGRRPTLHIFHDNIDHPVELRKAVFRRKRKTHRPVTLAQAEGLEHVRLGLDAAGAGTATADGDARNVEVEDQQIAAVVGRE